MTRYLVTGGTGFLGGHIVKQLLQDPNASITIVSRNYNTKEIAARISCHVADITNGAQVHQLFLDVKPQVVIHTASPRHTERANVVLRTNVHGTRLLIENARVCPECRAFVYTSSDSAIQPSQTPITEEQAKLYDETNFSTTYGKSKAMAEVLVTAANSSELSSAVIRIAGIYGEHDTNLIPQLLSSVRKNEHKTQIGENKILFEFVYAPKAAEAHILAARALLLPGDPQKVAGETFFITDDRPQPFFDFFRRCYAAAGHPVDPKDVTVIPLRLIQLVASIGEWLYMIFTLDTKQPALRREAIDHLAKGCCWSIEKAKQRLGYEPIEDQDAAIERSMRWAQDNL